MEMQNTTTTVTPETQQDLTISIKSSLTKNSPMSKSLINEKLGSTTDMIKTFVNLMKEKGEHFNEDIHLVRSNELEFDKYSVSYSTLQSFLLKAEALGKKITFEKTYTVKISE